MRFSIVVPVYKVEEYLERCVRSILDQTYRDFQLVLVDDGSPDGCGAMCDAFAQQDERVTVLHTTNGGVSAARNCGIAAAVGEYIAFVDADDYIADDFLEQAERILRTNPEAELIQFAWRDFPDGQSPDTSCMPAEKSVLWEKDEALRSFLHFQVFAHAPWSKMIRRELLKDLSFPIGVRVGEDLEVSYQLLGRAESIVSTNAIAYYYCVRVGGAMGSRRLEGMRDAFGVFCRMYRYFSGNFPALKEDYTCRYINDLMQLARELMALPATPARQDLYAEIRAALAQVPEQDIAHRSVRILRWLLLHCRGLYFGLYKIKR